MLNVEVYAVLTFASWNIIVAVLETAGQFFYVYAMATNAAISAVFVSPYCVLSRKWFLWV